MTVPLTPPDYQALKTNTVSVTVKPVPTDAEADNDTDPLVLADMIETYAHTPFHTILPSGLYTPLSSSSSPHLPSPPPPTPATTQSMVARAHILAFICDEVTRIPHEESFLSFTPSTAGAGRSPRTVETEAIEPHPFATAHSPAKPKSPLKKSYSHHQPTVARMTNNNTKNLPLLYTGVSSLSTNTTGSRKAPPPPLPSLRPRHRARNSHHQNNVTRSSTGTGAGGGTSARDGDSDSSWETLVSEDTLHDNDTDNDKPVTPTDGDELHIGISQPCSVAAINSSQAQAPAVFPGLAVAPAAVQRRNSLLGRLKRIAIVAGRKNRKSPSPSQSQAPFSP